MLERENLQFPKLERTKKFRHTRGNFHNNIFNYDYTTKIYTVDYLLEQETESAFTINDKNKYICDNAIRLQNQNLIYRAELNTILYEWFASSQYKISS